MKYLYSLLLCLQYHIMNFSLEEELRKMDDLFEVLTWKNPFTSFFVFIASNYVLWFLVDLKLTILGLFFLICFVLFTTTKFMSLLGYEYFNAEYNADLEGISYALLKLLRYRRENPLEFCFMMSMFFLMLAYISSIFSAAVISFFILWCAFLAPLIYKNLPPLMKEKLEGVLSSLEKFHEVIEEDDLMPLPIDNNPDDNEDVESLCTDRTADSITNSLISGISSMPSFLDAEDNHEILEEDLIPINQNYELTPSFGDSSDSESELKEIHLKESNFSRDSSSDEDGKFEEGLHFEDTQNQTFPESKGLVHNIVDYVTSAGGFQLSNIINNAMSSMQSTQTKNISTRNSTSDEDFEIIDLEEVEK